MSKTNKIFEKVPVKIQNRSGFDMSHYNLGTLTCGTLVPLLAEPLAPGDRVSLGNLTQLDLPPLATNFYGRVDFRMEAFFVPYRILMQQWKKFATYKNDLTSNISSQFKTLPYIQIPQSECGPGSLADYLGVKREASAASGATATIPNPLPFLAYHKIYSDWYRDKILQKEVFEEPTTAATTNANKLRRIPFISLPNGVEEPEDPTGDYSTTSVSLNFNGAVDNSKFADGSLLWELRQRNFHKDYFTTATPTPQAGDPVQLKFQVIGDIGEETLENGVGSFTIASLRAANSLQKFIERNNLAGDDYADQIQANFGVRPSDTAINYPIYLGSQSYNVYNRSIFQTGNGALETSATTTNNPFKNIGAEYGKASSMGQGSLIDNFEVTEFGILMVIGSLVPHSFYATGTRRYLYASELSDFPIPLLASVGDQEIYKGELIASPYSSLDRNIFGYTGRYSQYKYHDDEVHGELRDGSSLEAFAVQRSFDSGVTLGSEFIKIPKTMLDQVMSTTVGLSKFSAWYSIYFDLKKSSELPVYCVPTLGDEPDTHTELIDRGGKRL